MEYVTALLVLVIIGLVVFNVYKIYKKIKDGIINTDDLVLFILREVVGIFNEVIESVENKENYDFLKEVVVSTLYELIQESALTDNIKLVATKENISLLVEPSLKYLYEGKVGKKSRIYSVAKYPYTKDEDRLIIEEETYFIYKNFIDKK